MMHLASAIGLARSLLIYRGQPWKTASLRCFYRGLIAPGDLCFDIGAHVGNRSAAMLACGATVVALEPQPLFNAFLRRFARSDRLTVLNRAVAASAGTMTLRISSRHPTVTTLSSDWIGQVGTSDGFSAVRWDREKQVDVTTLDLLIAEFGMPRFCKIDVEGMEAEILNGLSRPLPLVAFEYLPASLDVAFACIARLGGLGTYRYNWVAGETHRFRSPHWLDAAAMKETLRSAARTEASGDVYARLEGGA